jgi:hypothetical protein
VSEGTRKGPFRRRSHRPIGTAGQNRVSDGAETTKKKKLRTCETLFRGWKTSFLKCPNPVKLHSRHHRYEEHGLKVSENRVLRRILGPKRDEVIGGWRKLHNEELHNLYCSPSIITIIKSRRMRWSGHVA